MKERGRYKMTPRAGALVIYVVGGRVLLSARRQGATARRFSAKRTIRGPKLQNRIDFCANHGDERRKPKDRASEM
jgi:hypothetical protein